MTRSTYFAVLTVALLASAADSMAEISDLLIEVPASVATVFVAETETAKFHRFDRQGGELTHTGSVYLSIGKAGPGKQRSGDKRTPLGVYFVTEQLDTSRLHEKYGITAFPLDYPNEWDQQKGRDGDGIWVHGVLAGGGQRPALDTDGCLALPNEDLFELIELFENNKTPVVVTRQISWVSDDELQTLRSELNARISTWAESQFSGDLHTFLSLYDDDFERWQMNREQWSALYLKSRATEAPLVISEVFLSGYPDEDGLYLSRFTVTRNVAGRESSMPVRLFWQRGEDAELRIVAEDAG